MKPLPIQAMSVGTLCRIVGITGDPAASNRIQELGLTLGTICTIMRKAPFGGPIEVAINRTRIALRTAGDLQVYVQAA